jgi:hypothetical protein
MIGTNAPVVAVTSRLRLRPLSPRNVTQESDAAMPEHPDWSQVWRDGIAKEQKSLERQGEDQLLQQQPSPPPPSPAVAEVTGRGKQEEHELCGNGLLQSPGVELQPCSSSVSELKETAWGEESPQPASADADGDGRGEDRNKNENKEEADQWEVIDTNKEAEEEEEEWEMVEGMNFEDDWDLLPEAERWRMGIGEEEGERTGNQRIKACFEGEREKEKESRDDREIRD